MGEKKRHSLHEVSLYHAERGKAFMQSKDILKQLSPYKPGKQIEEVKNEYGLERIVKLASNENPFGFSTKVKEAIPNLLQHVEIYPDGYSTELRTHVAKKLVVDPEALIFGCGSDEVVQMISRAYLEPGTNTVMATPTFPQYRHNALIEGAELREVPLVDGYHNLDKMLASIDHNTRVLWLCSPNNPTGCHIDKESFEKVMLHCPKHVLVVVDEAYYEYMDAEDAPDTIKALNKFENLIVLRTFSKAYGLAGLRIGYGVADKKVAAALEVTRGPFNTTSMAQQSALIALEDKEFLRNSIEKNSENKQAFMQFCDNLNLNYFDSQANFLFVHLPMSGDEMFQYLLSKGYIVRSGEALGLPNGIRVTIGRSQDMEAIQNHIKEAVQ